MTPSAASSPDRPSSTPADANRPSGDSNRRTSDAGPAGVDGGSSTAPRSGPARSGLAWYAALAVLTFVALLLRLAGSAFLLPDNMESDGGVLVRQVALVQEGSSDPGREENWSYYPHLVARIAAATTRGGEETRAGDTLADHLHAASLPHVRVREVVAWLSVLAVPGTWWLARRFMRERAALFACAWVALSQLGLCFAQEARPHAPAAATALFAVLAALHLRRTPTIGAYLLGGLAAGIAVGTLQSGAAVWVPLAAAHGLRDEDRAVRSFARTIARVAVAVLAFALVAYALYPSAPGGADTAVSSGADPAFHVRDDGNVQFFGHTVFLGLFNGRGFVNVWGTLAGFEPVLLAISLAASAAWIANAFRTRIVSPDVKVVLAYVLPYLVVIGLYERTYERFVLQLAPFLACAAAWGIERLASPDGNGVHATRVRTPRRALALLLGAIALVVSGAAAVELDTLRRAPDTSARAASWIAEHVTAADRVAIVPFVDVPLARADGALDDARKLGWLSPWLNYQLRHRVELAGLPAAERFDLRTLPLGRKKQRDAVLADPLAYLRASGAHWFLVPAVGVLATDASLQALRTSLIEHGKLAWSSNGSAPVTLADAPLDVGDSSSWWRRNWTTALLTGRASVGDVLEIYRLD